MRNGTDIDEMMRLKNKRVAMQQRLLMDRHSHFPVETQELLMLGIQKEAVEIVDDEIMQAEGTSAMAEYADNE